MLSGSYAATAVLSYSRRCTRYGTAHYKSKRVCLAWIDSARNRSIAAVRDSRKRRPRSNEASLGYLSGSTGLYLHAEHIHSNAELRRAAPRDESDRASASGT